ncbi:hypothetical protein TNCV_1029651 [Trichonephila clavipes]|nr:hypothetical protein TNCV_1029651 [Trichonephila clavipes]
MRSSLVPLKICRVKELKHVKSAEAQNSLVDEVWSAMGQMRDVNQALKPFIDSCWLEVTELSSGTTMR